MTVVLVGLVGATFGVPTANVKGWASSRNGVKPLIFSFSHQLTTF